MSRSLIKVQGMPNLRRDSKTGAILAINTKDLKKAQAKKRADKKNAEYMLSLEERVAKLESLIVGLTNK